MNTELPRLRSSLISHLESIKNSPDYKEAERKLWVEHARALRPLRLSSLFLSLVVIAEHLKTTTYGDLGNSIHLGSAHELNILIRLMGELCKANDWPPFPVLIKNRETGKVGKGFFRDYPVPNSKNPTPSEMDAYEQLCQQQCFDHIPGAIEIHTRIIEFVASARFLSEFAARATNSSVLIH